MATKKRPKFDETLDGLRVRVYSTRQGHEVVFGDDDYEDPKTYVLCYPKSGSAYTWAQQARSEYDPKQRGE